MNKETMDTFIIRRLILRYLRHYFDGQDYFEVETPVLTASLGVDYKACLPKTAWPPTCRPLVHRVGRCGVSRSTRFR